MDIANDKETVSESLCDLQESAQFITGFKFITPIYLIRTGPGKYIVASIRVHPILILKADT